MDQQSQGDIINNYQEYVRSCEVNGVTHIMSENDWNEFRTNPNLRFNFNPTGIANLGRQLLLKNQVKLANAAANGPQNLMKVSIDILKEEGLNKAKSILFDVSGNGNNNEGGVPGKGKSNDESGKSNLLGSYIPMPIKAEFKPGLINRSYQSLVNDPTARYATTHLLGLKVSMPGDTNTVYYVNNVLVPVLQQKAQSSVNFRIDLSKITASKLTTYIDDLIKSLNTLYFGLSLIAFSSIPNNRDVGLLALRNMITADDIDYLQQLKQLLGSLPIPPNLNSLVFFMNQNFQDSDVGDGLFKFMPISFNDTQDSEGVVTGFYGTNSSVITACINSLNSADNREVASILLRIAPNWMMPTIYDPSAIPMYSKLALTIFANAGHKYYNGTTQYIGPIHNSTSDITSYLTFDNNIDGAVFALSPRFVGTGGQSQVPSVGQVVSTRMVIGQSAYYTNRFSYVLRSSDNTFVWRESNRSIESAFGRLERSRAYLGTEYYAKLPGSMRLSNLNLDTMNESSKDLLSWVLSFDSIKSQKTSGKSWSDKQKAKQPAQNKDVKAEPSDK